MVIVDVILPQGMTREMFKSAGGVKIDPITNTLNIMIANRTLKTFNLRYVIGWEIS